VKKITDFDFEEFVADVFAPSSGETVLFLTDEPSRRIPDNEDWLARRDLVEDWRQRFETIGKVEGFEVLPLLSFPATGHENSDFPLFGTMDGERVKISQVLLKASLAISMSEFSMTSGLAISAREPGRRPFRAASAPLARKDMENSCYNIDYSILKERCSLLEAAFEGAIGVTVRFSGGHECYFDIRHRTAFSDNGYLRPDKAGPMPLINLPSGEVGITPYEGEIEGDPSRTRGTIPIPGPNGGIALFKVEENKIVEIQGEPIAQKHFEEVMRTDPARRNVGEISFGCNEAARISGLYIEDEKAGFHWGYGRSEFLGGTVGPDAFLSPETVLHDDNPCANGLPVTVESASMHYPNGSRKQVLTDGEYVI